MKPKLLIIIPAYNESKLIESTMQCVISHFRQLGTYDFTVVVADSSNRDNTRQLVQSAKASNPELGHDEYRGGMGKGEKIRLTTLSRTGFDVYCFIDADLPISMNELTKIVEQIAEKRANLSIACKYIAGAGSNRPFHRILISRMGNWFFNMLLRTPVHDFCAGSKAWDAELVKSVWPDVRNNEFFFDTELIYLTTRRGYKIAEVPVHYIDHRILTSKVSIIKLAVEFFKNIRTLMGRQ